jgi:hypothetical protein
VASIRLILGFDVISRNHQANNTQEGGRLFLEI